MSTGDIKAEILAPAGNYECFLAAINAGADAVYLGGNMFGARAFAGNFTDEELVNAINYAHLYGKKVYLTVNTLLRNDEIDKLIEYIRPFYEAGLDAAIVQDLGVFSMLRNNFPGLDLHASTQMTITGVNGAKLLKKMGASRVVTARELSAKEIKDIHDNVDIEIESFVHGALCYSYSGQCLLSSMIGGRSGNRGRCAQPCRLCYSSNGINDKHLLSPKDMCTVNHIPDIIEAGIFSLKIEGRMKGPEYVAGVVSVYRKYLDMYLEKGREGFKVDEADIFMLMDLYNRGGFCEGYYYKQNDKNMMTFDRPNHQGTLVGKIKNGSIYLLRDVNANDVLEVATGVDFTLMNGEKANKSIKIPYIKGYRPKEGINVYRTRNNRLLNEIYTQYVTNERKLPIQIGITLRKNENAILSINVKANNIRNYDEAIYVTSTDVIEESLNRPATKEDVVSKLIKLGNTPFICEEGDVSVNLEGNLFVPVKLLNELRRQAVEELMKALSKKDRKEAVSIPAFTNEPYKLERVRMDTVMVMTDEQLKVILDSYSERFDRIYVSTEIVGVDGAIKMLNMIKAKENAECFIAMPYIFRKRAVTIWDKHIEEIKSAGFDGLLLRCPEEIEYIKNNGLEQIFAGHIMGDYNMYTYNSCALRTYNDLGICGFTLSEELNNKQLMGLVKSVDKDIYLEKIVYGHLPLMISAGCTLSYTSKNSPCNHPGVYYIKDRMDKNMPAINSCHYCYNLIFNYVPEYLLDKKEELINADVLGSRIVFTIEDEAKVRDVLDNNIKDFTRGHLYRGVE